MSDKVYSRDVAQWLYEYQELLETEAKRRFIFATEAEYDSSNVQGVYLEQKAKLIGEAADRLYAAKAVLLDEVKP